MISNIFKRITTITFLIMFTMMLLTTACDSDSPSPTVSSESSALIHTQDAVETLITEKDNAEESSPQINEEQLSQAASEPEICESTIDESEKVAEKTDYGNHDMPSFDESIVMGEDIGELSMPASSSPQSPQVQSQTSSNGTGGFAGYNVTVLDKSTLAVTSGGYDWPITKYYFVTADGKQLGFISGADYIKIQEKLGVVPQGGGPYEPPSGGDWEKWFANEFNIFRGLAGGNSGSASIVEESTEKQTDTDAYASEIIRLVNEKRKSVGLHTLEIDSSLVEHARIRAKELSIEFGHVRPDGTKEKSECIARFQTSPTEAFNAWMKSDSHRTAILNENGKFDYNHVGTGCYQDEHGTLYWVLTFSK